MASLYRDAAEHVARSATRRLSAARAEVAVLVQQSQSAYAERRAASMAPCACALLGSQLSWHRLATALPPRCSHRALTLTLGEQRVMVVLGGMANNEWHATTLVVAGLEALLPCVSYGEGDCTQAPTSVFAATSSNADVLSRREISACACSGSTLLVSGGVSDGSAAIELWRGSLSFANGAAAHLRP